MQAADKLMHGLMNGRSMNLWAMNGLMNGWIDAWIDEWREHELIE